MDLCFCKRITSSRPVAATIIQKRTFGNYMIFHPTRLHSETTTTTNNGTCDAIRWVVRLLINTKLSRFPIQREFFTSID